MSMKRILKKVEVSFISLVGKGANGKTIIYKSQNHNDHSSYSKEITILKTDPEKKIVYGIVYSPDEIDSQGDTATADVIEEMAYEFMKSARTSAVDQQHDFKADEGFVAESWILKQTDALFPNEKPGSWAVGIKVTNDATWDLVKSGEITGLSLAGAAVVEEIKGESILNKLRKWLGLEKDFNEDLSRRKIYDLVYAWEDSLWKVMNDPDITDKEAAILSNLQQFADALANIGVNVQKAGKVISSTNLSKLKTAIKELQDLIDAAEKDALTKSGKETDMTPDEIKAAINEAIAPLNDKVAALEKTNAELLKAQGERIEALEKSSPGSQQAAGQEPPTETQKFSWLK